MPLSPPPSPQATMGDERRIALKTVVRGYPFKVYAPFRGDMLSTPDHLILNGHELTDEELAQGEWPLPGNEKETK